MILCSFTQSNQFQVTRIGINGFVRKDDLFLKSYGEETVEITHINDPFGDAEGAAHLLEFDSVHAQGINQ